MDRVVCESRGMTFKRAVLSRSTIYLANDNALKVAQINLREIPINICSLKMLPYHSANKRHYHYIVDIYSIYVTINFEIIPLSRDKNHVAGASL